MKLLDIPVHKPFELAGVLGKTGSVIRHGDMGSLVRYHGSETREVKGKVFQAPHLPVMISGETEVNPLVEAVGTEVATEGKRKRGRPKGSRNKPKSFKR